MGFSSCPGLRTPMVCLWLAVLALTGCGGKRTYPVEGKIVVKGSAFPVKDLSGYIVTFESQTENVGANGTVGPDGTFRVGTFKEGDGAVAGKHRVSLMPPMAEEGKRGPRMVLPARYYRFETSGLEVVVEPRKTEITLEVEATKR
jgi:hypothetical protein